MATKNPDPGIGAKIKTKTIGSRLAATVQRASPAPSATGPAPKRSCYRTRKSNMGDRRRTRPGQAPRRRSQGKRTKTSARARDEAMAPWERQPHRARRTDNEDQRTDRSK